MKERASDLFECWMTTVPQFAWCERNHPSPLNVMNSKQYHFLFFINFSSDNLNYLDKHNNTTVNCVQNIEIHNYGSKIYSHFSHFKNPDSFVPIIVH